MLMHGLISRRFCVPVFVAALALAAGAGRASAATVTIEPDDYAIGTDLTGVSPYATLLTLGEDNAEIPEFEVTAADGSFMDDLAATGDLVFSHSGVNFWSTTRKLQARFNGTTSEVGIAFAGGAVLGTTTARMEVYDASGNLLGTDVSEPTAYGVFGTLSVTRPQGDIARAVAYGGFGEFVRLDALTFATPVPEPAGVGVAAAVGALLLTRRR